MEQGEQEGMQTFDSVIENYIRQGLVTKEDAMPYASNQGNLLLRLADWDGTPEVEAEIQPPQATDPLLDLIER
jgi:Tfp pilus assembly ATPase PilU